MTRPPESLCRATKANGEPCGAFAGPSGLCVIHADPDAARELGRKGGQARTRSVVGLRTDDELRGLGRRTLAELLQNQDTPAPVKARIATALFSYGTTPAPADATVDGDPDRPVENYDFHAIFEKLEAVGLGPAMSMPPAKLRALADSIEAEDRRRGRFPGREESATGSNGSARPDERDADERPTRPPGRAAGTS